MDNDLRKSAKKVQQALDVYGLALNVIELNQSTRTAVEAAEAIGCEVGQIAKSLVFATRQSGRPILVIASGINRVNEKLVGEYLKEKIRKPEAKFVREATGYTIGGIPPVGHPTALKTLIDRDLLSYPQIWAAAGTPFAVFSLSPEDLIRITGGEVLTIHT